MAAAAAERNHYEVEMVAEPGCIQKMADRWYEIVVGVVPPKPVVDFGWGIRTARVLDGSD